MEQAPSPEKTQEKEANLNLLEPPQRTSTADGSFTLYSPRYQQSYASSLGAYNEAVHVFLQGAGVTGRLAQGQATKVLEVGLGTGLNFLLTADYALQQHTPLHYEALEHTLLPVKILASLNYATYIQADLWQAWLEWRESLPDNPAVGSYGFNFANVQCTVHVGEALEQSLAADFHAVYMDAFSPEANPELWSETFLQKLYDTLLARGILASYCVKGVIRRRLAALGFEVIKRAGPAKGKREVLQAHKV